MLPYGRHWITEDDIQAVVDVLRSDWLTTGPAVEQFEQAFARFVGAKHAVAVSNGTAALHSANYAIGITSGDEVIVPAMTFAATASAVVFQEANPVFADVDAHTLLIDKRSVEASINARTKAVVAVDYAGQPCDYDVLREITDRHNLWLIADACHSVGASLRGRSVGTLADLSVFSFHPVKPLTTGEGGIITTNDADLADRMRRFRNHGITKDLHQRRQDNSWEYAIADVGFNYRISDFQCALGTSQLSRLPTRIERRRQIAQIYDQAFADDPFIRPLAQAPHIEHAYHLYVVRIAGGTSSNNRSAVFKALRSEGIGVNVHYIPVHLHPYYVQQFGTRRGTCPIAEHAYEEILSLPIFPQMEDTDVQQVIQIIKRAASQSPCRQHKRSA